MTTQTVEVLRVALAHGDDRADAELLDDLVQRRDPAAVEAIIRRHGPMVWGVCRRALSYHDAEDAFQATFLVLARRAAAIWPPGLLGNWLYGVARRTALKARSRATRRQLREATVDPFPDPPTPDPDRWTDLRPILDHELECLPGKYRAPLILCDLEGRTRPEAARRLGWPEGTVCSRLAIGRKKLGARLARRGLTLSAGVLTVTLVEQAAARVPAELSTATVRLVTDPSAPQSAAAVLAERVLRAMSLNKVKLATIIVVAAGLVGGGMLLMPASGETPAGRPGFSVAVDKDSTLVLRGHTDNVFAVAFSPDGKRIATASFDRTIKLWAADTGKELLTIMGHKLPVVSIAFESDGKYLVTAASKFYGQWDEGRGEVVRWNAETGEQVRAFAGHELLTFAATPSPDGTRIAAVGGANGKGELTVWDVRTGKILYRTKAEVVWPFMAVDYSPNGKSLAVGGGKEVRVYDAATGAQTIQTAVHPDPVYATAFSPDGQRIASAGVGKPPGIRLWDANTGKRLPMIEASQFTIRHLAYSRDGTLIAAAAHDGTARVYDVATGTELLKLKHDKNVNAVAFDPSAGRLAVACEDGTARVYILKKPADVPARAESQGKKDLDARRTAEAFLDAAVAGKVDEARAHADFDHVSENKVKDFAKAGIKRVDVSLVLAGEAEALMISEPVELEKEGKGHILLQLRKKDRGWRVRDIDFEPAEKVIRKQRDFLEAHPEAKAVPAKR